MSETRHQLEQIDDNRWRVPRQGGMRTEGLIFSNAKMMASLRADEAVTQVANVAHLPGIVGPSIAMPDFHWGYGFPIGGVAAFDLDGGVISPGGVGYDICCGVRLMVLPLTRDEVRPRLAQLVDRFFDTIPSGLGASRSDLRLSSDELDAVCTGGARWAVRQGFGVDDDLACIEDGGALAGADPACVSDRARKRGRDQLATLGSGNHFIEVGYVAETFDNDAAAAMGLTLGCTTVFVHTGSRGLGHQVCDDYIDLMVDASRRYGIKPPDKQLCCAPLGSPEADSYLGAMNSAANFAFANRQIMSHYVRTALTDVFGDDVSAETHLVYDVAHNMAKIEEHTIGESTKRYCVHRKGATRAFPPGHGSLPKRYRELGQPVLIPGDMGRYSYVMVGTDGASQETFGSSCHGAGRQMSRRQAKKIARNRDITGEMAEGGVVVRSASRATVNEEMPEAYKDVRDVVEVVHNAGIGKRVAKLRPMGVVKG